MTTIYDLSDELLLRIGAYTDNPQITSVVSRKFSWVACGCLERIFREIAAHPEARVYLCADTTKGESVKKTYQFVVQELKRSGMQKTVFSCSDLCETIASKLIPFHESYLALFDQIVAESPGANQLRRLVHGKTLLMQCFIIRSWMIQNPGSLDGVREISLSQCGLKFLPPEIALCSNLVKLRLAYNELTFLPESVGKLWHLNSLSVAGNQIEFLPESVGNLKNLTHLSICGNQMMTIPNSMKRVVYNLASFAVDYFVKYEDGSDIRRDPEEPEEHVLRRLMQNAVVYLNLL